MVGALPTTHLFPSKGTHGTYSGSSIVCSNMRESSNVSSSRRISFCKEDISEFTVQYSRIFPRIERDNGFLIQHDAGFAVRYLNFSFQLMAIIIFVTVVFTAWHLIYLVRNGARYPADNGGMKVHLGYALIAYFVYYYSNSQISFALPSEPVIFKIPMNAMGLITSAILYSGLIVILAPHLIVDDFNRALRLLIKG